MDWPSRRFPIPTGPGVVRVNLGCGLDYREGWINVDWNPTGSLRVDRTFNLEDVPWPFETSSVDYLLASHVIEHVRHEFLYGAVRKALAVAREAHATGKWNEVAAREAEALAANDGLVLFMEQAHRALRSGGLLDVLTPIAGTTETWLHPTHTRAMEPDWWTFFSDAGYASRRFYSTTRYRLVDQWFERSLDSRAPLRWLGVTDYHVEKYAAPIAPALKRLGRRRWHLTRLAAVK